MKKGIFVIILSLVLSTWAEAQIFQGFVFTVKKFVRIEFQSSNWIQSSPGEGGCISYTANGAQSLTLFGADGITEPHSVNAGQVVFVCGDVAHIPPR